MLPRADAEEAVQEALVRAWLRRDACRSPEAPLPWLLEITRNEARRVLGRRRGAAASSRCSTRRVRRRTHLAGAAVRLTVEQALARSPSATGACCTCATPRT